MSNQSEPWINRWLELMKYMDDIGLRPTADQRDELRAKLDIYAVECMVGHGVPLSIACKHMGCDAFSDGLTTVEQATAACWSALEPADPSDCSTHFYGNCPDHCNAPAHEDAAINKATIMDEFSDV